ncbi:MAG: polysaccharide deacetylase family protein [Candidatus Omnitrophota bacterium]
MIITNIREGPVINAITVDVEEWYQTILFNRNNNAEDSLITNLQNNINDILLLLDEYNTKATFFIVASLAVKYPKLIKIIFDKGHEICCHNYYHRLVYKMSKKEFSDDIGLSLDILRKNTNKEILGFRAPSWSIIKDSHWAIDILHSYGLKYDSSIYPINFNLLHYKNYKRLPYRIKEDFIEFPPSTFKFLGNNLPFAGGIFMRFLHSSFIINKIREINDEGNPAMIYFHSWEFDRKTPSMIYKKWKRLIQYGNLSSIRDKIKLLLENFKFCPIKDILQIK